MGACLCKSPPEVGEDDEKMPGGEQATKASKNSPEKNKSSKSKNSPDKTRKLKQPKPKYYIQIASVYLRQRKENGEFVDMDPKYYKSWNDEPCTLDTDVNELFEPFEDSPGEWHWVESDWTASPDFTRHNKSRQVRQKQLTRVAIYERDYGTSDFLQEQIIKFIRKFIWHARFFNADPKTHNLTSEYDSSDQSDSQDVPDTPASQDKKSDENKAPQGLKAKSKSMASKQGKLLLSHISKSGGDENPLSNPRCVPYKIFLSQLHNLARKMYEYNNSQDRLTRKSMADVVDFQFSQATQKAMNNDINKASTPPDARDAAGAAGTSAAATENDAKDDAPFGEAILNVTVTKSVDAMDDEDEKQPNEGNKNLEPKNGGSKEPSPSPSAFALLGVDLDAVTRNTSLDTVPDVEHELLACQNTFDKLAKQMRQASFRMSKYSRDAMKNLELFLRDFIERHLKLLISSTVAPNVKELLLLKCLLDVVDVEDSTLHRGSPLPPQESPLERLQQIQRSHDDATSPLQKDALFCLDIFPLLDTLVLRIESLYKGVSRPTVPSGTHISKSKTPPMEASHASRASHASHASHASNATNEEEDPVPTLLINEAKIEAHDTQDTQDTHDTLAAGSGSKSGSQSQIATTPVAEMDPAIDRILHCRFASGVLEVNREDDRPLSREEVEASDFVKKYRDLMRKIHPDRNNDPKARDAFERVQESYDHLKNGHDFDFMRDELARTIRSTGGIFNSHGDEYSQSSLDFQASQRIHFHAPTGGIGGSRLQQHSNLRDEAAQAAKAELHVLGAIVHKLKRWLCDAHASDPEIVCKVMQYYKRLRLVQHCAGSEPTRKLGDESTQEAVEQVEEQLEQFMTKSAARDYRRLARRISAYRDGSSRLSGSLAQAEYSRYWDDVQMSVSDCVGHMVCCRKKRLFTIASSSGDADGKHLPRRPLTKLMKMFYNDNIKMLPKLDGNVTSLRSKLQTLPFAPDSIFVLKKMSDFIAATGRALREGGYDKEREFKLSLEEITRFVEDQLNDRFSQWVNCAICDIATIIWKILDKNPSDASSGSGGKSNETKGKDHHNKDSYKDSYKDSKDASIRGRQHADSAMEKKSVQAAMVDSFTFIHHLIDSWFNLLTSLPQPELKASCTKYFAKFFNAMLRVCLTFLNEMRPRFEQEDQAYADYYKQHCRRSKMSFAHKKRKRGLKDKSSHKESMESSERKADESATGDPAEASVSKGPDMEDYAGNPDNNKIDGSSGDAGYGINFERDETWRKISDELLHIGYGPDAIERAMRHRGSENLHAVMDYLLLREKETFATGDYANIVALFDGREDIFCDPSRRAGSPGAHSTRSGRNTRGDGSEMNGTQGYCEAKVTSLIFGRKGKISEEEYELVCIMLAQMDAVMMEISKMDQTFSLRISELSDFIQPKMQELADYFVDSMEIWCENWVNKSISLLSKQLFLNEFKMKDLMYKTGMEPDNNDMEVVLQNLHHYVNIFLKSLRQQLHQKIMDTLCHQFVNVLLWILLDPRSQRKFYRAWILGEKQADTQQLLLADKFEQDMDICKKVFVTDFGISKEDFNENAKSLAECFELMRLTTAELIYKHQKRATRKMITAPDLKNHSSGSSASSGNPSLTIGAHVTTQKHRKQLSIRSQEIPIGNDDIVDNEGLNDMLFSIIVHRKKSYADEYVKEYLSSLGTMGTPGLKPIAEQNGGRGGNRTSSRASSRNHTPSGAQQSASTKAKNFIMGAREWPIKKDLNAIENDRPLFVEIIGGKNLRNKRKFGKVSDCQAELSCLDQTYTSKVLSSNLNPRWKDEGFIFLVPKKYFERNNVLELGVQFNDKKHFLGMYKFQISRSNQINETKTVKFAGKGNNLLTEKDYGEMIIHINSSALFEENANYNFG